MWWSPALIGIVSDVHGNLAALEAVLEDAGAVDAWWCLGDVVGYGPEPAGCLSVVRARCEIIIAGNHDRGVTGELPPTHFNATARQAVSWTRTQLSDEELIYLANVSLREEPDPFTLVHGSPRFPLEEYILTSEQAHAAMAMIDTRHLMVGHSHIQCLWAAEIGFVPSEVEEGGEGPWLSLEAGQLLINPGSVGQPRDGDPRAAYILVDDRSARFQFRRVAYPVAETQRALRQVGLPATLAERLTYGI